MTNEEILSNIRTIPDFPKEGIMFKDITTALKNKETYNAIIDNMYEIVKKLDIDYIVAVESRGYILGAPLAYKLKTGLIIVRKPGKLPAPVKRIEYGLEYGKDTLEIHLDSLKDGDKVLIVDDLLATGGTVNATIELVESLNAKVVASLFLIELEELSKNTNIKSPVLSLIKC
ncbi:MAG: adenine phosphoribosyltransferase [Alphaproteobacteria bacterium]|nr:adenine phosphoribosyltransferase [Alphaproteobacteria bacterium]